MNSATLIALGDIMLGELSGNIGYGVDSYLNQYGYNKAFSNIKEKIENNSIVFGNIEAVLDKKDEFIDIYSSSLIANPKSIDTLKSINLSVANVANNHSLDHGLESYTNSYDLLKESGIKVIGSVYGNSISTLIEKNGIKFYFIGFSLAIDRNHNSNFYYQPKISEEIIELIKKNRDKADHTIISVHWGKEYIHYPTLEQRQMAYKLIDSGASLILGHHPHCYQGIEKYKDGLIVYSLGNCVFDDNYYLGKESIIFVCSFNKSSITSYRTIPIKISKEGIPYFPDNPHILEDKFNSIDKKLNEMIKESDEDYTSFFDKQFKIAYKNYRKNLKINYMKNLFKINPKISFLLLKDYFVKRLK